MERSIWQNAGVCISRKTRLNKNDLNVIFLDTKYKPFYSNPMCKTSNRLKQTDESVCFNQLKPKTAETQRFQSKDR